MTFDAFLTFLGFSFFAYWLFYMPFYWEIKKNGKLRKATVSLRTASNIMYFGLESAGHVYFQQIDDIIKFVDFPH